MTVWGHSGRSSSPTGALGETWFVFSALGLHLAVELFQIPQNPFTMYTRLWNVSVTERLAEFLWKPRNVVVGAWGTTGNPVLISSTWCWRWTPVHGAVCRRPAPTVSVIIQRSSFGDKSRAYIFVVLVAPRHQQRMLHAGVTWCLECSTVLGVWEFEERDGGDRKKVRD